MIGQPNIILVRRLWHYDPLAWRDQRDWTERKYATWKAGERMPSQMPSSPMRCPCGETFDSHKIECTLTIPHITASHSADGIPHR
jgi:hypothetical protein